MIQYLNLLKQIKQKGTWKEPAREGMPSTLSLFGAQIRFDLAEGFPLLTTKKVNFKNIVTELLWFLRGDTNIKYLIDNDCNIWNEDAYNYYRKKGNSAMDFNEFVEFLKDGNVGGDVGRSYGYQWRNFDSAYNKGVDQLANLITGLKKDPMGRRHILTAWNPRDVENGYMALPPCHTLVQFNCRPWKGTSGQTEYYLDCQMYQRSADVFLGVPYNIASYALLTHILAKICKMVPGDLIISFGDVHIYDNHMAAVDEQLTRTPEKLPTLHLADAYQSIASTVLSWADIIDSEKTELFKGAFLLEGYNPAPAIKAKLSTGLK